MPTPTETEKAPAFAIFRNRDGRDLEESGIMSYAPVSDAVVAGGNLVREELSVESGKARLLFSMPGMSLAHAWFKSGFPLPRHSHDGDCLYYILAGSLRMGTEELGAGDGFFVGGGVPYTYTPGDAGVEVLEFRGSNAFDIKILANNPAFWAKAVETVKAKREDWTRETPPSGIAIA